MLAYAPMSNGWAKRMVGTPKKAIESLVSGKKTKWDHAVTSVVMGYRVCSFKTGLSPFELVYVVKVKLVSAKLLGTS